MRGREEYRVAGQAEPISHYTDAVRAGDLLFVSGIVPVDADGRVVGGDVVSQARQVFENMRTVLAAAGARPASTLVEISRLAVPGARIEVEAVALVPS